jgi:CRP-like cAMP-binding protein
MILSEQTVNIITTREIYESMLIKVAGVLGEPIDEIRNYLVFTEVIPGKPVRMYGARWEFFYTVHTIPTIGFRVSVDGPDGKEHTLVHSSDTTRFAHLEEMRNAGAITTGHETRMKGLVQGGERLVMIDGGGPPIHGDPADFEAAIKKHPSTDFLFYHVNPDLMVDRKIEVATPGWSKTYLPGKILPQSLILKLLKTMKLLEVSDITWINILLSQGDLIEVPPDQDVVHQGQTGDNFYFVLAGSQKVLDTTGSTPQLLAILEGGDFFGEMSIIREARRNATVRTMSASVLFKLPGHIFLDFVEANGLKERFERIWLSRNIISEVKIFRNLHPHAKHEISLLADAVTFDKEDFVIRQGGKADDFFIITRGYAEVVRRDGKGGLQVITKLRRGDFFGENVAMGYRDRRNASVVATSKKLETLRFSGRDLRRLAESAPVLRHELHIVMKERGMTEIPVTPRESMESDGLPIR